MNKEELSQQETSPADQAIADLRQGGTLSKNLPGHQERPAQIEMAEVVVQALSECRHAVIEAGTGTGKTMGYLIPVVRAGRRVTISTANKALQDQIFEKDIPFVQQHVAPFESALVKGSANYICLRTSKGYARTIRESLPPAKITHRLEEVSSFFHVDENPERKPTVRSLWGEEAD